MDYTYTQDKKIMEFDISKGYDAFIELFTEEEIESIKEILSHSYNFDGWEKENIIYEYIKYWLISQLDDEVTTGSRQLFEIIYNLF